LANADGCGEVKHSIDPNQRPFYGGAVAYIPFDQLCLT
jgi:hypothetical protein